ncbi:MAG: DEAD/DEAH box helicase, partial [Hyphomicrobium sp.]
MIIIRENLSAPGRVEFCGAPEGFDALLVADLAAGLNSGLIVVARDDARLARMSEALAFFRPELEQLDLPAWDCLPYDRVSPNPQIVSRRIHTLIRLMKGKIPNAGQVVLTTMSAVLQRVPPRAAFADAVLRILRGERLDPDVLLVFLQRYGYLRAETVVEAGEYAVRGGIIDVFPPGLAEPVRLDFFGDEVESIRLFDPASQRTTGKRKSVELKPVSEISLDEESIVRFRSGYRALFGAVEKDDPLYEAVTAGRRHAGMEHWLPLFHERLETVLDYAPGGAAVVLDHHAAEALEARLDLISEYYAARLARPSTSLVTSSPLYHPVPPDRLFVSGEEWRHRLSGRLVAELSPFAVPATEKGESIDAGGRPGIDFAEARRRPDVNVFDALAERIADHARQGRRVVIAATSRGAQDRLGVIMAEHGIRNTAPADGWAAVQGSRTGIVSIVVLALERGFTAPGLAVIAEQDILGDRLIRRSARRARAENVIAEASALTTGDLVVHMEHGIGQFDGLETISVTGAPHDCLRILYADNNKLYLPVENIEVISRYGTESAGVQLDRLGSANWQARKARMKARIRDMADQLIQVAAGRTLRSAPVATPPDGLYDEFCTRFPFAETEDQARAIEDVLSDLASGRPTDRLVCGDVGFGKTEVALRAAFVMAMEGRQVAVVVPTTLLCRQHFRTFRERFAGYPVRIAQLSRLVTAKNAKEIKAGLASGQIDIVIGTHMLLSKSIVLRDLGLLVIDEEQHFGVAHKEALKKLREDVHV